MSKIFILTLILFFIYICGAEYTPPTVDTFFLENFQNGLKKNGWKVLNKDKYEGLLILTT
jgi:hypothetical protein